MLLAQREPLFLASLLDRTLPQRALRGEFAQRLPKIRDYDKDGPLQPTIIINIIADQYGCGLTCEEVEEVLTAMEQGVGLRPNTSSGRTVADGVERAYKAAKPQTTKAFWSGITQAVLNRKVVEFVAENRIIVQEARAAGIDHLIFHPEVGCDYKVRAYELSCERWCRANADAGLQSAARAQEPFGIIAGYFPIPATGA